MAEAILDSNVVGPWGGFSSFAGLYGGQMGIVTDYGEATLGGLRVIWDDVNDKWRIAPGAVIARSAGIYGTPVQSLTGVNLGKFSISDIKIPANGIADGSRICVRARVRRVGSSGAAFVRAWLGTGNSTSDGQIGSISLAATAAQIAWLECQALFSSDVDEFFPTSTLGPMEEITGPTANQTSNVARGSEMKISIGVTGISISSETFQLMDYLVWAD
jgi:hypothetical protein